LNNATLTTSFSGTTVRTVFQLSDTEVLFPRSEVDWENGKFRGVDDPDIVDGGLERRY